MKKKPNQPWEIAFGGAIPKTLKDELDLVLKDKVHVWKKKKAVAAGIYAFVLAAHAGKIEELSEGIKMHDEKSRKEWEKSQKKTSYLRLNTGTDD